ncbi:MAG TPA: hypothetical protein VI413_12175 [Paludibacter sp.]
MKQYLVAIVRDEINQPGNFESSRKHLKAYCENESLDYTALMSDLRQFFGLLADYNQIKDPVLYKFLTWQACNCFFDEAMFGLLPILPPEEINPESFGRTTSATHCGMVGGHLIGL